MARHGTRSPSTKRIPQLNDISNRINSEWQRLTTICKSCGGAYHEFQRDSSRCSNSCVNQWMGNFESFWKYHLEGGELTPTGEEEHFGLGKRLRRRFPAIFSEIYHPSVYPIFATQIPRASASAVAFGLGLFEGSGSLGVSKLKAFSVVSESKKADKHLRFHETCRAYVESKKEKSKLADSYLLETYSRVSSSLNTRTEFRFSAPEIGNLWLLCKHQASALGITEQACSLFSREEYLLLEWADDVALHWVKGYGFPLNYQMAVPLLEDVFRSIDAYVKAEMAGFPEKRNSFCLKEKARLRFAHAETIIPFVCLLGLFKEEKERNSETLPNTRVVPVPGAPPMNRVWRGSAVAPFAANTAIVLYDCSEGQGGIGNRTVDDFKVLVLQNEQPVQLPGCGGELFCPFVTFKSKIVEPQLQTNYDTVCSQNNWRLLWKSLSTRFQSVFWAFFRCIEHKVDHHEL